MRSREMFQLARTALSFGAPQIGKDPAKRPSALYVVTRYSPPVLCA